MKEYTHIEGKKTDGPRTVYSEADNIYLYATVWLLLENHVYDMRLT